jgi:uncharacterized membrane protein YfcA
MNILFIAIGLGAGILAGLFGIGGGVVIVPALVLLARMEPQVASGTSLAALLLPVGALGAWAYYKEGYVRMWPAVGIAVGLLFGAWIGARISMSISPVALRRSFAIFLVLIAARMWFK